MSDAPDLDALLSRLLALRAAGTKGTWYANAHGTSVVRGGEWFSRYDFKKDGGLRKGATPVEFIISTCDPFRLKPTGVLLPENARQAVSDTDLIAAAVNALEVLVEMIREHESCCTYDEDASHCQECVYVQGKLTARLAEVLS